MSPPENKISPLKNPITSLWGVGAERAAQLARLGIFTVEDLLLHRPKRYEDRRHFRKISELTKDEPFTARGKIVALGLKRFRGGSKSVFEIILDDGSARLHCRWWNLPFMENYFAMGDEVFVFGKLKETKPRTMDHPETEVIEAGEGSFIHINRIAPIYPLTEGLQQRWLRGLIWRTLESELLQVAGCRLQVGKGDVAALQKLSTFNLQPSTNDAIRMIHFPEELTDVEIARRRLALDEFIALQIQIQSRRNNFEARTKALPCGGDNHLMKPFLAALGFKLTEAQTKVLREIRADMSGLHPMRRLLQGDVGSGKTAVAACSALMAIESGFNIALMAPTEILAEQHFRNFQKWFAPLGVKVELQTGNKKGGEWRVTSDKRPQGSSPVTHHLSLTIGTHALLSSNFDLPKLGLVIIDEQHKFGVAQREQLVRKGNYPHLLVMTATPIPRTLGLTLYGDLDVSTIEEMPGGRGKIKTFVRGTDKLPNVFEFIRERISAGRQAYVVYPRVEDSGAKELKAVTVEFEILKKLLAPFRVGLLHGRLNGAEKENVMADFRANKIHVLLSTSLIEVGVDVANATIMLIENAEQFGLAQLHQLRGRIGRGAHESFCILTSDAKNAEARARLKILEKTNDGFEIAEADLKLRGPGELLGREQSGLPDFRFGNLAEDSDLIRQAREIVRKILTANGRG
ncbi:MAG TPA: ATP-dependent DNA helicase RecG [Candidatus Paceibacterota bacterium]|nr:ATP-dependent DNA helicase RecG [Candidatus Paceibacterota bacterium]